VVKRSSFNECQRGDLSTVIEKSKNVSRGKKKENQENENHGASTEGKKHQGRTMPSLETKKIKRDIW